MVDEFRGPEEEGSVENDDGGGGKVISVDETGTGSPNAKNSHKYEDYAPEYIKIACKWVTLIAWPWIKRTACNSGFWTAAATVAIAATTITYTIYARRQWRAMLDSNTINLDSLQTVQRAFVQWSGFTIQGLVNRSSSGDQRVLDIVNGWENSGSTPATGVFQYFRISELANEPDDQQFGGQIKSINDVTYIGPKGHLTAIDEKPFSFYIGNANVDATQQNNRKIFFWGWIIYRDAFPGTQPHITEVCKRLTDISLDIPPGNKTRAFPSIIASNATVKMKHNDCQSHNCVDRYCTDYETLIKLAPPAN